MAMTAVNEDWELAGQGRRLAAYILDFIIFVIVPGIVWLIWILVVGGRGQSPAKHLLGIHVIHKDGKRAGLGWMLLREIAVKWGFFAVLALVLSVANPSLGSTIAPVAFAVAALWCAWDANRQCLWDKAIGTYVVKPLETPGGTSPTGRAAENLQTLQELRARGLLTDEEYEERRARELENL